MLLLDFFYQLWKNKEEFNKKEGLVKMEKSFPVINSVVCVLMLKKNWQSCSKMTQ